MLFCLGGACFGLGLGIAQYFVRPPTGHDGHFFHFVLRVIYLGGFFPSGHPVKDLLLLQKGNPHGFNEVEKDPEPLPLCFGSNFDAVKKGLHGLLYENSKSNH